MFENASYLYRLGKTWLETNFHLPKSRNQVWVDNGSLILPHYLSFWQFRLKATSYLYGLSQTWLETQFQVPNSRNEDLVHNGLLILPHCVICLLAS